MEVRFHFHEARLPCAGRGSLNFSVHHLPNPIQRHLGLSQFFHPQELVQMGVNVMSGLGFADWSVHQSELDVVADRPLGDVRQLAQLVSGKGLGVHVQKERFELL